MTKPVTLSDDAYKRLKNLKGKNESFSDVVVKLTGGEKKRSILEYAGGWSDIDDETFKEMLSSMKRFRKAKIRRVRF